MNDHIGRVLKAAREWGLLLLQDARLPSIAGIVAGGPVRGSWWAHAASHAIYRTAQTLEDHPELWVTKLVGGKVTYVHRRLWPALVAVGSARESWQLAGLSAEAHTLLEQVDRTGRVRARSIEAKPLERTLLLASKEVHTDTGAHALEIFPWHRLPREVDFYEALPLPADARAMLEEAARALSAEFECAVKLPWMKGVTTPRRRRTAP